LDIDLKSLARLERVQVKFLRRMLGVGRRSVKAVLFSETGIWPIKYRRVHLALKRSQSSALSQTFLMQVIQVRNETCFNFSPKNLSVEEVELQQKPTT
jgi:hypothetical protein